MVLPSSPLRNPASEFRAALNLRSGAAVVAVAVLAAVLLNPIFMQPFPVLLGRTLALALLLLLAWAAARQWRPRWLGQRLPHRAWPLLAVALAAPLGTALIYLVSFGGIPSSAWRQAVLTGYMVIAGCGLVLGLALAGAASVRERLAEARARELELELERSRLEKQALDARLALLQAQIEPHFLFNTLANVQALVESGSPRAADVLRSLSAYLRAALAHLHDGQATLGHELVLVRAYLELMQMRMPDRLRYRIDAAPALSGQRLPPMALLTLVENAVRDGIDPLEEGGSIEVEAVADGDTLRLAVADSGKGIDPRAPPGVGLANLRERLQACFGDAARLELHEREPQGLRAEIVIRGALAGARA